MKKKNQEAYVYPYITAVLTIYKCITKNPKI